MRKLWTAVCQSGAEASLKNLNLNLPITEPSGIKSRPPSSSIKRSHAIESPATSLPRPTGPLPEGNALTLMWKRRICHLWRIYIICLWMNSLIDQCIMNMVFFPCQGRLPDGTVSDVASKLQKPVSLPFEESSNPWGCDRQVLTWSGTCKKQLERAPQYDQYEVSLPAWHSHLVW